MRETPRLLVADDHEDSLEFMQDRLIYQGYEVITATNGEEALAAAREHLPDLILLDVVMPRMDGVAVCRALKADPALPFMPVIMVTALSRPGEVVGGLDAGADEYVTKPVDANALAARVRSMLRIKQQHDALTDLNDRLRLYVSPQVADLITSSEIKTHRREVSVLFCDLRGYTKFSATAPPERFMAVLGEYHAALGTLVFAYQGTLERFIGDGMMVFFNDPVEIDAPQIQAVQLALAIRDCMAELTEKWRFRYDCDLGFGIGIDYDWANLGRIGFERRYDYAAVGPVTNRAARLCAEAADGQILVSQRLYADLEQQVAAAYVGELELKGFGPVRTYTVTVLR